MGSTETASQLPNTKIQNRPEPVPQKWQPDASPIAWTIAGFDPSSGAGVTADLMTFAAHGVFGCSALTATTVQNTMGVFAVLPAAPESLVDTLVRLGEDLPPRGIKIGMLGTPAMAATVAQSLRNLRSSSGGGPVVVLDPVLRSSSGAVLYPDTGLSVLEDVLLPLVDWITPNWTELGVLAGRGSGKAVVSDEQAYEAARMLQARCPGLGVVATGGDQSEPTDLVIDRDGRQERLWGRHIATRSTHGTGCAYSSALLCRLMQGKAPLEAAREAKAFVEGALAAAPGLGRGRGPMDLLWPLRRARPEVATLKG